MHAHRVIRRSACSSGAGPFGLPRRRGGNTMAFTRRRNLEASPLQRLTRSSTCCFFSGGRAPIFAQSNSTNSCHCSFLILASTSSCERRPARSANKSSTSCRIPCFNSFFAASRFIHFKSFFLCSERAHFKKSSLCSSGQTGSHVLGHSK